MVMSATAFTAGLLSWTLLEYLIHGVLGHLYNTFVTPLHAVHHRDPRAVFAIGAWIPSLAVMALLLAVFGLAAEVLFYLGLLCGFFAYEIEHYRLHFAHRLLRFERRLRERHLVHHLRRSTMCLGVVSDLWDRIFGTEPDSQELAALCASVRNIAPLGGPSNLALLLSSINASGRMRVR